MNPFKDEPFDIDDEFEAFMRRCYPKVKEHSIQYQEQRRVFMAGVAALYFYVVNLGHPDSNEEKAELRLRHIGDQVNDFFMKRMGFNA